MRDYVGCFLQLAMAGRRDVLMNGSIIHGRGLRGCPAPIAKERKGKVWVIVMD